MTGRQHSRFLGFHLILPGQMLKCSLARALPGPQTAPSGPGKYSSLTRAAQAADSEAKQASTELESDKNKLSSTRGVQRQTLQAEIDELQSELNLAQARSKTLHNVLQFVSGASGTSGNLSEQIDQFQHSVPELRAQNAKSGTQTNPSTTNNNTPSRTAIRQSRPTGILNLAEELFSLSHQIHTIDQRERSTDQLQQVSQRLPISSP